MRQRYSFQVINLFVARSLSNEVSEDTSIAEQTKKRKFLKKMAQSRRLTIMYCVVLLIATIAWIVLGAISHVRLDGRRGSDASGRFRPNSEGS